MKYIYSLFLIATLSLGMVACQADEDIVFSATELAVEGGENLDVEIRTEISVNISQGGGDYEAFSLNKEVVDVKLEGTQLLISGKKIGKSSIVITDSNNKNIRINVTVFAPAIRVDKSSVEILYPYGDVASSVVNILEGNGKYNISINNEDIGVELQETMIRITTKTQEQEEGVITVSDGRGLVVEIPVKTESTRIPYANKEEREAIMADGELRFIFYVSNKKNDDLSSYDILNSGSLYGWDDWDHLKLQLNENDVSVGMKENVTIDCNVGDWDAGRVRLKKQVLDYFEIIKNDGVHIWAVYGIVCNVKNTERLVYGHFCQKINEPVAE